MTELVFEVQEDPDGGLTAMAVGASIFTEADTVEALRENIREAVSCHFERADERPRTVRLHFVRDEVIAL
ncbi:MAG TPA: 2-oxoisovalerate dehydrogenase E1 subunit beta [Phycisphaerae bacterium]|nr:2-oxoisovalerate dehydrogenase E1 subunit beta [Phycisphaerae bacterium]